MMSDIYTRYRKSFSDILQGINKLDYLLKVSAFQKHKSTTRQRHRSREVLDSSKITAS